jgi:hypothetical protein
MQAKCMAKGLFGANVGGFGHGIRVKFAAERLLCLSSAMRREKGMFWQRRQITIKVGTLE